MGRLSIIILFGFIMLQCTNKTKQSYENILDANLYLVDSLHYTVGEGSVGLYGAKSICSSCENENLLLVYNAYEEELDIIDVLEKEKIFSKKINDLGIEAENGLLEKIHFYSYDSIFVQQEYAISIIDTSTVVKKILINDPNFDGKVVRIHRDHGNAPIHYHSKMNGIFLSAYSNSSPITSKAFYDYSIESFYDLKKDTMIHLPISYTDEYFTNFFGFMTQVSRCITEEKLYYSFPIDKEINLVELTSFDQRRVNLPSDLDNEKPLGLSTKSAYDRDAKYEHMTKCKEYGPIVHDKYRHLIYRFYRPSMSIKNDDGSFNSYGDKSSYLMVYDENFKKIGEFGLGQHTYSVSDYFVSETGLAIGKNHYKNKKHKKLALAFDVFDFTKLL